MMTKKVFKEHPKTIIFASFCILLLIAFKTWDSCAPLSVHDWNKREISRVKVTDSDNFTFAVFGDNQGNSSFFEPLLRDIEHRQEIAFAIDVGDLVSSGEKKHFRHFLNQVQGHLAIPLFTVLGNHDLNGDSSENYMKVFGSTYYAFQVGKSYFIVLDTSTPSIFGKTQRRWLEEELKKAQPSKARFVFMHVPLFDPRGMGFCLPEKDGKELIDLFRSYQVTHLFTGHIHGYFSGVWEGVPYTITGGAGGRLQGSAPEHYFHHYVQVYIHNAKTDMIVRRVDERDYIARVRDAMRDYIFGWGLLIGASISLLLLGLSLKSGHSS